jgi:hypothetical protein
MQAKGQKYPYKDFSLYLSLFLSDIVLHHENLRRFIEDLDYMRSQISAVVTSVVTGRWIKIGLCRKSADFYSFLNFEIPNLKFKLSNLDIYGYQCDVLTTWLHEYVTTAIRICLESLISYDDRIKYA